jgi:MoxR-like ATPase
MIATTQDAPMTTAARDGYEPDHALPPPGSRVWITGFSKQGHEAAARLLGEHGLQPTAFAAGADAILAPSPPPEAVLQDAAQSGRRVLTTADLEGEAPPVRRRPAVEITAESVRILDVTLPRRAAGRATAGGGSLVPGAERFAHLCLDATFLVAARAVALAARPRLPCALEGDTAVAKTTAVLWVAHLCRQEAVRLNLNGQSDTGELVGRFVPATDWPDWDLALLERESGLLRPTTRAIVARALAEGRGLNWVERNVVAGRERIPPTSWRFWEGIVPAAMRHGRWVVLDEMNLAEPQILERLNPVLEQPPTLVLSENDGVRFGPHGDVEVADGFRMFATLNPAEYAGRSVLSPAFRDRWTLWTMLEPPGETEFRALLDRLVHGVQPEFLIDNVLWKATDEPPLYPELDAAPGIDRLLDSIAAFHAAVATSSGGEAGAELGRARRERYVFTRRTLLALVALVADRTAAGTDPERAVREAVELLYVQRVQPGPDRAAVRMALRAAGLGSTTGLVTPVRNDTAVPL